MELTQSPAFMTLENDSETQLWLCPIRTPTGDVSAKAVPIVLKVLIVLIVMGV